MTENTMATCPTEVLLKIFTYLNAKNLTKCREVCWRWKRMVDDDKFFWKVWRRHCHGDFKDICETAYYKRDKGLSWFGLYRSLALWSKLRCATEKQDTLNSDASPSHALYGFQLVSGGKIGVNFEDLGLIYCDVETLERCRSDSGQISENFTDYVENEYVILLLKRDYSTDITVPISSNLHVIRKATTSPLQETESCIPSVKFFFVTKYNVVYFVTCESDKDIYTCNLSDDKLKSSLLMHIPGNVANMGYKNGFLYVLIRNPLEIGVFALDTPRPVRRLDIKPNLMHLLNENEQLQDRFFNSQPWVWNQLNKAKQRHSVEVLKIYGDVIFAGLRSEFFHIYYVPQMENHLDVLYTDCKPVKQYNFKGGKMFTHIDVMEGEDGHTVLVGMITNIMVLRFNHDFTSK